MPVSVFANALLMGANRAVVKTGQGALRGPLPPHLLSSDLPGYITYPQSKKSVLAPSDWNPASAHHSASLPESRLELEHVFGYDGRAATAPNIAYNSAGELVYYAAAVGIVYSHSSHKQRFFLGHDNDIRSLAMHPERALVATGQLAAAESVGGRRADPYVAVWNSETCEEVQRLWHGRGMRGVQCVAFSPSGGSLTSVCTDDAHSLFVWSWRTAQCLLCCKSKVGTPPAVYGIAWSRFERDRLATFGQNHVTFWRLRRGAPFEERIRAQARQCDKAHVAAEAVVGRSGKAQAEVGPGQCGEVQETVTAEMTAGQWVKVPTHTVGSALWLPCGSLLTGSECGALTTWRHGRAIDKVQGHDKGSACRRPDGTPAHNGVRAILLLPDERCVRVAWASVWRGGRMHHCPPTDTESVWAPGSSVMIVNRSDAKGAKCG
jgi:microtubule-associated protein-like 6